MKIPVRMLAHHNETDPKWRVVTLDNESDILAETFRLGQNDFQVVPKCCSVSVGDVICLPNDSMVGQMACSHIEVTGDLDKVVCRRYFMPYVVKPMGFSLLTWDDVKTLEDLPRRDRTFHELVRN
jgi:hypothetical protein